MAKHDDDPGAPKPSFVPPTSPGAEPSGGSSLFAPPTFPSKPGAAAPPVVVPSKPPASAPVFAEWPVEPAKPVEPETPIEPAKPVEAVPRAPLHARKTSTQAHTVVGEFGVPPQSDSKPSMPIVDDRDDEDDEDDDGYDDDTGNDDADRTDEDPKPLPIPHRAANDPPPKRSAAPLWIGLGLAATLVVAVVVGMQDRKPSDPRPDPPKPDRSEPVGLTKAKPHPRPPGDTRTKLGDPPVPVEHEGTTTTTTTGGGDTTDTETGGEEVDPRDPSVIPAGTPEENAKAFLKLPVSIHDGPPRGGIGRTGIHVDAISTGREYRSGTCKDEVSKFSIATDKEVSVCFRVVHDREEETVRILWDKDGTTTRRANVRIRDIHAYKTRAYLELRPEYVGTWRARVISEDEVELASAEFEIGP